MAGSTDILDALPFDVASPQAPLMVMAGRIGRQDRDISVLIDTGAAGPFPVFVGPRLAKKLGLRQSATVLPPAGAAIGANPPGYRSARLDQFTLGPVRLNDVPVAVTPLIDTLSGQIGRRIDAIVGATFLKPLVVSIDFPGRTIDLMATPGPVAAAQRLRFAPARPLVLVTATINGAGPFTMELDTGASHTSLSPAAAAKAGVVMTGSNVMTGAGGSIAVGTGEASIASAGVTRFLPQISVTPAVEDIGRTAGTPIDGIIGLDWLARLQVTIDGPGQRWWVMRVPR